MSRVIDHTQRIEGTGSLGHPAHAYMMRKCINRGKQKTKIKQKRKLNENRRKFINFADIGGFGGSLKIL